MLIASVVPLALAATAAGPQPRPRPLGTTRHDATIISLVGGLLVWQLVLQPTIADERFGGTDLTLGAAPRARHGPA